MGVLQDVGDETGGFGGEGGRWEGCGYGHGTWYVLSPFCEEAPD